MSDQKRTPKEVKNDENNNDNGIISVMYTQVTNKIPRIQVDKDNDNIK